MRACNWNVTAPKKIYFRPDDPRASLRYDSPKKCPTILYRVNLWLETVSATCDRPISRSALQTRVRILVQVTIHRRLRIGRDGHLDQSEAYDIS